MGYHNQATNVGPGIVIGRKGSIGSVTWTPNDFVPIDTTYYIVPVDEIADLRWAYHFLARENLSKLNRATGIPGLNRDDVYSLSRLLPPLPEQRAIAAMLDSIDDAIEGAGAVIAAAEGLRDALLHDLLTRGVPGWHTEWREVPGLGTIPAGWQVVRLGDVAEINRSNWNPADGSSILYLDLTAVTAPGVLLPPREIDAAEAPSRARRRVSAGDILVSTVRPNLRGFARVHKAPDNLIASTGFAVVTPSEGTDGSFIYHHVMTPQFAGYLEGATTGQAYPAVRPSDVAAYTLPLPPLAEQQAIAPALDGVDAAVEVARWETNLLKCLKKSAADALLTGRVRAKDEVHFG